jgi:hypothetical protein
MPTDADSLTDRIHDVVESGSAYERRRLERGMLSSRDVPAKLTYQSALFAMLSLVYPMYGLFGSEVHPYLPALDPAAATPKVLLLAVGSYAIEVLAMIVFIAIGVYHVRRHPVTRAEADQILNFEGFATIVAFGTGLLGVTLTVGFFGLGVTGVVEQYVELMGGINPFDPVAVPVTVELLGALTFVTAIACFFLGQFLRSVYPGIRTARAK